MSGSYNRQQRRMRERMREKEAAFNARHWEEIIERQNRVDDRVIELTAVCIALALNDLYGWNGQGIQRVINQFCSRMASIAEDDVSYEDLRKELENTTGIVFEWKR